MPEYRYDLEVPSGLDNPITDMLPDQEITIGGLRRVWIQQSRLKDGRRREVLDGDPVDERCLGSEIVLLTSDGRTTGGSWELDVRSVICHPATSFGEPSITATPVMGEPTLTSIGYWISADNSQLTLRVFTTKPSGEPVDAYFHWHAAIPVSSLI